MLRIVGLMSGTSADGIDVGIIEIDGAPPSLDVRVLSHRTVEYDPALRAELFAAFRPETGGADRIAGLNAALGEAYAAAVLQVIAAAGFTPEQIDLIGSHGQALWYDAPNGQKRGDVLTLGEPAVIAERTGITTISGFRARDLAAGGRGAPLVSYLDWLLFRHPTHARALQNIGGIGNVTGLPPLNSDVPPVTFDTGPGNMIIDYCTGRATNGKMPFDRDGALAAKGTVNESLLAELMAQPYIRQRPPKTTGRELFGAQFGAAVWVRGETLHLSAKDIIATVTAFTAESIASAVRELLPYPVAELYIAGGGAFNPTLRMMIQARLPDVAVKIHDELGISSAAKECVLFAVLAYETWNGRPGALPVFTGALHATLLGNLTPGRLWPPA
ncbi:MAG: anhydro-N-acetylmuramic acid kinase [Aggregatilineales bacterium]